MEWYDEFRNDPEARKAQDWRSKHPNEPYDFAVPPVDLSRPALRTVHWEQCPALQGGVCQCDQLVKGITLEINRSLAQRRAAKPGG